MRNAQEGAGRNEAPVLLLARDPDEASRMFRPRDFRFLPRGGDPFRVEVRSLAVGRVRLSRERGLSAMLIHGSPAPGTAAVFAPLPSAGVFRYVGRDVAPGELCVTHSDEGWAGSLPGSCDSLVVTFQVEALRLHAADLGLPDPQPFLDRAWILPADPTFARRVQALMREAETLRSASRARHLEEGALELALAALLPKRRARSPRVSLAARRRVLKRAVEYALDHLGDPPRVVDLCRATGVSVRTLEYVFREAYDVTPSAFLKAARLTRVRLDLARAESEGDTVTQVAVRWGFDDPGRFARAYAHRYGELPSATLRRRSPGDPAVGFASRV
jgi:AraC-like DNA-binding protein